MIYNLTRSQVTDTEYDFRIFWWLEFLVPNLPDIYRVEWDHLPDLNSIKSNEYILFIKGNEKHHCFDHLYNEDPRLLSIIKNFPAIKNQSKEEGMYAFSLTSVNGRIAVSVAKEDERTINLPLGYCNGFVPSPKMVRPINMFFCGNYSGIRENFFTTLKQAVEFTEKDYIVTFPGSGCANNNPHKNFIPREKFCKVMGKSLFALCPSGASPETYRLSEAASSGCLIINDALPNTEYFSELPSILCPSLGGLVSKYDSQDPEILKNIEIITKNIDLFTKEKNKFIDLTSQWYNKWVEPSAVAKRIIKNWRKIDVIP